MDRTPVTSTNIATIGYDPTTMTLEVEFLNGSVYQYFDVPEGEFMNLMGADSKGRYLNQYIKASYRYGRT